MSVIMFAGASQFVALELFRSGASPPVVIATTLLINLRHLLMAASLRPHFGDRPLPTRLGLAYLLTDEAFAMATSWYRRGGRGLAYYVTFAASMWVLTFRPGVRLRGYLDDLPIAVIAALAGAGVLAPEQRLTIGPEIAAAAAVILAARWRRNLLLAVLAGIAIVAVLRAFA